MKNLREFLLVGLWRYNSITGYWVHERNVTSTEADKWLEVFQKDQPNDSFQISIRRPTKKPA